MIVLLVTVILLSSLLLCHHSSRDHDNVSGDHVQYLVRLTRVRVDTDTMTAEDMETLAMLRREVVKTETIYRERHAVLYDVDCDSDEEVNESIYY